MKNRHRILRPKRFRLTLLAILTCFAVIGALTVAPAGAEVNPVEVENFGNNSGSSSSQFGSDNNDDDDEEDDDPSSNNSSNNNSGSSVTTAQQAANEFSNGDTGGEFGTTADPASDPDPNANNSSVGGFGSDNNDDADQEDREPADTFDAAPIAADDFSDGDLDGEFGASEVSIFSFDGFDFSDFFPGSPPTSETAQGAADEFSDGDLDGEFGSTADPADGPPPGNGLPPVFGDSNETIGVTADAPNGNSLSFSYLNDSDGNSAFQLDFHVDSSFGIAGELDIDGTIVSVNDILPNDEGGTTTTTINGAEVMVTYGRDVLGVASANGGIIASVQVTSQEVDNEGSSSSTQTTATNAGAVVNVSIPGYTLEGQAGVGFQTTVGQSVTQDPNRPNVVTISETTNSGFFVTGTVELQLNGVITHDGIGGNVGSTAAPIGGTAQATGTQITQSTTVDMSTGEVLEQMIVVEEPGPFGQPGVGIGLTPDALTIFNIDGTGTTSNISTAVPVPPPPTSIHGNPFEVVDDAEDTPEALPAFDGSRAPCVDSDGDGFGWDGTQTCRPTSNTNTATPAVQATPAPACVDSDGDGFGWDGFQTCVPGASNIVSNAVQAGAAVVAGPACVDSDGDGWGWDGTQSCRI